jgi:membrane-anchored protein YejM (alkaline phosphatase superfamily)
MPLLGVRNPASDYSLGYDLLDTKQARKYTVFASWTDLGYRDDAYKAKFPRESGNVFDVSIHTGTDAAVADADEFYTNRRVEMADMMRNSVRFSRAKQRDKKIAGTPLL